MDLENTKLWLNINSVERGKWYVWDINYLSLTGILPVTMIG